MTRVKSMEEPKRFNLVVAEELFDELQKVANEQQTTVTELIRRFIKLGILAYKVSEDPNTELIIRSHEEGKVRERELLLF